MQLANEAIGGEKLHGLVFTGKQGHQFTSGVIFM